jgi:hypothetical protein
MLRTRYDQDLKKPERPWRTGVTDASRTYIQVDWPTRQVPGAPDDFRYAGLKPLSF